MKTTPKQVFLESESWSDWESYLDASILKAKELMRARIDKAGYVKDEIEGFKEVKITESGVIHFDDGDY